MTFYTAEHKKGRRGRHGEVVDEHGTVVLGLFGDGVRDERGKLGWYPQPSMRNIGLASATGDVLGQQAIDLHRSMRVAQGRPRHWATVTHPGLTSFTVTHKEEGVGELGFQPQADNAPDAREINSELLEDGTVIARHWPTPAPDYSQQVSRYEVLDTTLTLPYIVQLFNARYLMWRPHRAHRTFYWDWQ
jgi:hypothetical protein